MTLPGGISIEEACQIIIAQPAPVLLPDTCALLDVVRAPIRNSSYLITLAGQLSELAAASPKRLHVVISHTVTLEWNAHLAETVTEVETALQAMRQSLQAMREACMALQLAPPAELSTDLGNLPALLRERATGLYDAALVLGEDSECLSRAFARQALPRRPARQGKGMNDCTILEHALCLCSQLQAEGFSPLRVFSSSNTADYCTGRALHPELAPSSRPRACSLHPTYAPRDTAWVFRRRAAAMWRICGDALDLDLSTDGAALPTGISGTTAARGACDGGIFHLPGDFG